MKDHILGLDEYLIRAQETIQQHLDKYSTGLFHPVEDNQPDMDHEENYKYADENLAVHNIHNGCTTLHVFNHIIKELQGIHNQISKEKATKQTSEVQRISQQLFQLKQAQKQARQKEDKQSIDKQIADIQRRISNDIKAKDKAAQMCISNFYRPRIGKMVPETFRCTKEKKVSGKIHTLQHEGKNISQQEEIVQVMQQWYEETAEHIPFRKQERYKNF
jgi:hypothetical protein